MMNLLGDGPRAEGSGALRGAIVKSTTFGTRQ